MICCNKPRSAHAGTVTLLNITFNLFAQTSQLAVRINLGSPQVWDTETRERKRSDGGQRKERQRKRKNRSHRDEEETKKAPRARGGTGNNRPITWVMGDDRSREPENRSLCDGSQCDECGETDSQSQELRLRGRRLILHSHPSSSSSRGPSPCRFCRCRCCHDRMNWMPLPVAVLVPGLPPPLPCGVYAFPCNMHLPRSGGREITRSFFPNLHSCQLMSHRIQRCAATFSVSFLSSALLPTLCLISSFIYQDGLIDGTSCRDELGLVAAVFFSGRFSPLHSLQKIKFNSQIGTVATDNDRIYF